MVCMGDIEHKIVCICVNDVCNLMQSIARLKKKKKTEPERFLYSWLYKMLPNTNGSM